MRRTCIVGSISCFRGNTHQRLRAVSSRLSKLEPSNCLLDVAGPSFTTSCSRPLVNLKKYSSHPTIISPCLFCTIRVVVAVGMHGICSWRDSTFSLVPLFTCCCLVIDSSRCNVECKSILSRLCACFAYTPSSRRVDGIAMSRGAIA